MPQFYGILLVIIVAGLGILAFSWARQNREHYEKHKKRILGIILILFGGPIVLGIVGSVLDLQPISGLTGSFQKAEAEVRIWPILIMSVALFLFVFIERRKKMKIL